ncbi:MAG TPA: FAD-binding oxidoreductase [Vicinamibacterales bacterium]|nr:FAD-binding oxidoreductase [Vicinamibacterales bacterium]
MIAADDPIAAAPHRIEPAGADALAVALKDASDRRLRTVVRGGGTKMGWGRTPERVDAVIGTRRLDAIVAHRHGDLTGTFQAGARLRDVNAALGAHRQWLPIDSAFADATIGGIIATNDAGPLRHRYGTARDLIIGVTLALTDGRIVKAGGHVVKNVAGYDLGRLMSGSFGTLAVIVDATFKLSPLWPASRTVVAEFADSAALAAAVQAMRGSQIEAVACDVDVRLDGNAPVYRLLIRVATGPAATAAQAQAARGLLESSAGQAQMAIAELEGQEETTLWRSQIEHVWEGEGVVARAAWRPAALKDAIDVFARAAASEGIALHIRARAGVGAGIVRIDGDDAAALRVVEALRGSAIVGNVAVLRASLAFKQRIDVWPPAGDSAAVARAVKQSLDPAGILNAGRGPL